MKRIAITGARGRLAPGLAHHLTARGHAVETFSRTAGNGYRSVAELTEPSFLREFDAVLHLGWSSVPLVSEENPGLEQREDIPLARAMVEAASACDEPPKLVFFSTAAVYGNTGTTPVGEQGDCRPIGRYAAAKLEAEKIFLEAPLGTVLRITNVFGAGCARTRPQGIIPVLVDAARTGNTVTVWGDGTATKDYIAVDDLHGAVDALLRTNRTGVFNVASGHVLSVNGLIELVSRAAGRAVPVEHAPHFQWDVEQAYVCARRLRDEVGWRPSVDPASAIASMVQP